MVEFPRGGFDNEVPVGVKKLPCAMVYDTSGSLIMYEDVVKSGAHRLADELQNNYATAATVEVMVETFDDTARIVHPFTSVRSLEIPDFNMGGTTHLYEALDLAYAEIRTRQEQYKAAGIDSYAPFLVVLTDGKPVGDKDNGIVAKIRSRNEEKKLIPLPFAIGDEADVELLKSLRGDKMVFHVDMEDISKIFDLVSVSLSSIATDKTTLSVDQLPPEITLI